MKIYRFIPDALHFRRVALSAGFRWWPEGLDLGRHAAASYPMALEGCPWPYDGNRYRLAGPEDRPRSDFPALALNVLVVSAHARIALRGLRGLDRVVAISLDDEQAFAAQLPALDRALDLTRSETLHAPEGEPLFVTRHVFDESQVTADAFWIARSLPFSDVYVTEAFRAAALAAGLVGLDYLELVHDDGPVVPRHAGPPRDATLLMGPRYELEHTQLQARADLWGYPGLQIRPVLEKAYLDGQIPFAYP